jgi:ADP-heptose:LPS heptosyltransferase
MKDFRIVTMNPLYNKYILKEMEKIKKIIVFVNFKGWGGHPQRGEVRNLFLVPNFTQILQVSKVSTAGVMSCS